MLAFEKAPTHMNWAAGHRTSSSSRGQKPDYLTESPLLYAGKSPKKFMNESAEPVPANENYTLKSARYTPSPRHHHHSTHAELSRSDHTETNMAALDLLTPWPGTETWEAEYFLEPDKLMRLRLAGLDPKMIDRQIEKEKRKRDEEMGRLFDAADLARTTAASAPIHSHFYLWQETYQQSSVSAGF